ncbi:Lactose transport system permease protein LacF [compost metagenome]
MTPPLRRAEARWAFWLLLPALLGLGLFTVLPTLGSFALSFAQWDMLGAPRWVGLANYADLGRDPLFWRVLVQTGAFVLLYVVLDVVLAVGLALALDQKVKALGLYRTAYFLPVVTSMVAGAILWSWIFDPRSGLLNAVLGLMHLGPVRWLSDPHWALPSLVVVSVWKNLGYDMLLVLAGLQAVPSQQLEAASLDGAGAWQRFRHVTLPLLAPTLVMVTMMATIRAFQTFDTVYLMTEGGPHRSTTILGYWLFQNAFTYFKLGKASALAYVLFAILALLGAVQWWSRKAFSHQEEGR